MPSDLIVAERGAWRPMPAVRMAPRRPERTAWLTERAAALLLPLVVPAVLLALWQLSATHGWVSVQVLPPPALVAQTLFDLLWSGDISGNLWISLRRILSGFLIGGLAGMALGVAMGLSLRVEHYLSPLFRAVAQVPSLGWLPFLILLVGIGEPLKFLIIAKACFVPMALNSFEGIRNIPPSFLEVARVFRLSRRALVLKVVLPATLPPVFSGVRLALSHAWIALVIVEMLASTEGIGYLTAWGRTLFQVDVVMAGMAVIGVVGLTMDAGLKRIERRLRRWSPAQA
ncbi:ABC transporter permease [Azospirillum argentinense]|uniref:ABC transporter permease n=1 Tax=Azospirillum brasilense TaxID=192 RepID=A0A4D8PRX4_AZOBR|nr:ABC transporter permease [Azospirillum argentinense]QCO00653.1 ABC transporter permease [Azospirillum argentinense]